MSLFFWVLCCMSSSAEEYLPRLWARCIFCLQSPNVSVSDTHLPAAVMKVSVRYLKSCFRKKPGGQWIYMSEDSPAANNTVHLWSSNVSSTGASVFIICVLLAPLGGNQQWLSSFSHFVGTVSSVFSSINATIAYRYCLYGGVSSLKWDITLTQWK